MASVKLNVSRRCEVVPLTISLPWENLRNLVVVKNLSMCCWMKVGSEEPSTKRSSSSEMKKKRGKALRFVTRYSLNDFDHVEGALVRRAQRHAAEPRAFAVAAEGEGRMPTITSMSSANLERPMSKIDCRTDKGQRQGKTRASAQAGRSRLKD